MNCPKCGADTGNAKYCPNCGKKIKIKNAGYNQAAGNAEKRDNGKIIAVVFFVCFAFAILITIAAAVPFSLEYIDKAKAPVMSGGDDISGLQMGIICDEDGELSVVSFRYDITNNHEDDTLKNVTVDFVIYDTIWQKIGSFSISEDMELLPGESLGADHWLHWSGKDCPQIKYEPGKYARIDDLADGTAVIMVSRANFNYVSQDNYLAIYNSDGEVQYCLMSCPESGSYNYPVENVYLTGEGTGAYYYIERDENGYITKQCSTEWLDINGEPVVPDENKNDYPYYLPLK